MAALCHSRFGISFKKRKISNIRPLRWLMHPSHDVFFCVSKKKLSCNWLIRVGCCEWSKRKEMYSEMDLCQFKVVDFIEGKLKHGKKSFIEINGGYQFIGINNSLQLT